MANPVEVRYAIVVGRFYGELAERLVTSATRVFEQAGADAVDVFDVPGAFELPLAAQMAAQTGRYAGVACLGAVIRGETTHYDYVCSESARGIMDVRCAPACRAGSASSPSRTWSRRWRAPAATSATRARTRPRPCWRCCACAPSLAPTALAARRGRLDACPQPRPRR